MCTTTGAPGPASPTLGPAHTHALTVAHTVALIPTSDDGVRKWDTQLFETETLTKLEKVLLAVGKDAGLTAEELSKLEADVTAAAIMAQLEEGKA